MTPRLELQPPVSNFSHKPVERPYGRAVVSIALRRVQLSITVSRRLVVAATATCLLAGGVSTTAADAAKKPTAKSVDKKVRKTDKRVASTRKSLKKTQSGLAGTQADLKKTDASLATASAQIGQAVTRLTAAEGSIAGILAAAPQLATGLQTLATAVQTQIAPGLQTLGSAYQSVEYGRAAVFVTNGSVIAGGAVTSADIPDDGNTVTTGDEAIFVAGAGSSAVDLRAVIRSAESDGDTADKTAGQAGGFVLVRDLNTGGIVPCAGATAPNPGIFGTPAGDPIVTPSGTVTNLPLRNIPGGFLRTDTANPTTSTGRQLLPAPCTVATTAGQSYSVKYSVNFVDVPTSTTPGPTE